MKSDKFIEEDGVYNMICEDSLPAVKETKESGYEGYTDKEKRNLEVKNLTGHGMA